MAKKTRNDAPTPEAISQVMAAMGAKGGANSRKNMPDAKKKALAKKAAAARWGNTAKKVGETS